MLSCVCRGRSGVSYAHNKGIAEDYIHNEIEAHGDVRHLKNGILHTCSLRRTFSVDSTVVNQAGKLLNQRLNADSGPGGQCCTSLDARIGSSDQTPAMKEVLSVRFDDNAIALVAGEYLGSIQSVDTGPSDKLSRNACQVGWWGSWLCSTPAAA